MLRTAIESEFERADGFWHPAPSWSNEIGTKWLCSMYQCRPTIGHEMKAFVPNSLQAELTMQKIGPLNAGVWFYSLATVATGILDLVWGAFEASHQPIRS